MREASDCGGVVRDSANEILHYVHAMEGKEEEQEVEAGTEAEAEAEAEMLWSLEVDDAWYASKGRRSRTVVNQPTWLVDTCFKHHAGVTYSIGGHFSR